MSYYIYMGLLTAALILWAIAAFAGQDAGDGADEGPADQDGAD